MVRVLRVGQSGRGRVQAVAAATHLQILVLKLVEVLVRLRAPRPHLRKAPAAAGAERATKAGGYRSMQKS